LQLFLLLNWRLPFLVDARTRLGHTSQAPGRISTLNVAPVLRGCHVEANKPVVPERHILAVPIPRKMVKSWELIAMS